MAARILFYMVHWLRSVKEFQMINVKDQVKMNSNLKKNKKISNEL